MSNESVMKSTARQVIFKDTFGDEVVLNPIGLMPVIERISSDEELSDAMHTAAQVGPIALLSAIKKFPQFTRWIIEQSLIRATRDRSKEKVEEISDYIDGLSFDELYDLGEIVFHRWFPDLDAAKKKFDRIMDLLKAKKPEADEQPQAAE